MAARYLLGIDVGTTSVKGVLVRTDGKTVCTAGQDYSLDYPAPDRCELDPEIYWNSTRLVIQSLLRNSPIAPGEILAIAFSSQGETLIAVDAEGRPIRKAIVWLDNRSGEEAVEIKRLLPDIPVDVLLMTLEEAQSNFANHNPLFLDLAEDGILVLDEDGSLARAIPETRQDIRRRGIERTEHGWRFPAEPGVVTYLSTVSNRDFSRGMRCTIFRRRPRRP